MTKRRFIAGGQTGPGSVMDTLMEGLAEGVLLTDLDGIVVRAGESATIITGRNSSELIGASLNAALGVREAEPLMPVESLGVDAWTQTLCRGTRGGGAPLTLRLRSRAVREGGGRPTGAVHLFSEAALQENLHRRFVAYQRLAGLGELSAALVHEVGNPVSVILGFAQLLMMQNGEDAGGEIRSRIFLEANRCRTIVEQLLDYAKSSARVPSPTPVSLREVALEVVGLLGYRQKRAGVATRVEWATDCPLVHADTGEMKQVFLNLLLNAIDASPQGTEIVITGARFTKEVPVGGGSLLSPMPAVKEKGWARVTVEDRGKGLGGGDPERFFAPFYSTKEKGGGLGLAVCRRIAEQLGGTLSLFERDGGGARAVLELPGSPG